MYHVQKRKLHWQIHTHARTHTHTHTYSGENNQGRLAGEETWTKKSKEASLSGDRGNFDSSLSTPLSLSLSLPLCHVNKITCTTHHFDNVLRRVVRSCSNGLHLTESEKNVHFHFCWGMYHYCSHYHDCTTLGLIPPLPLLQCIYHNITTTYIVYKSQYFANNIILHTHVLAIEHYMCIMFCSVYTKPVHWNNISDTKQKTVYICHCDNVENTTHYNHATRIPCRRTMHGVSAI